MNAQSQYEIESSAALEEVQSGKISQAEWNSRQRAACQRYFEMREKEKHLETDIVPNRIKEPFKWESPLPFPQANNAGRQG